MRFGMFPCPVTGLGAVTALGGDVETFWARLVRGESGIAPLDRDFTGGPEMVGATVSDAAAPAGPGMRLSRTERFAVRAAGEAVEQARLIGRVDPRRVAVVVGTTTGGIREAEDYSIARERGRPRSARDLLLLERAGVADQIARRFGFGGTRITLHTACASGASAIALAAALLRHGTADAAVAGGAESMARLTLGGFRALRLLDPGPCRPFDRQRRGLSLGEGAGMLVLEKTDGVVSADDPPRLAYLVGAAQTSDAHHLTAPRPDGADAARAIAAALETVRPGRDVLDHINAHGTGTAANDAAEAAAIRAALGPAAARCPVTSIKGSVGHTLGAAGAIEAIGTILALQRRTIPPTAGLTDPDPALGLDLVRGAARPGSGRIALSHSFGFGGANAVLCFARSDA